MTSSFNARVAGRLDEAADLLEAQQANPFRVNAYRRAASTVAGLDRDLRDIVAAEGPEGLVALPGVGCGIAAAIVELLAHGRWGALERLRGESDPVAPFRSVPGLGVELATRIHDTLHLDTLGRWRRPHTMGGSRRSTAWGRGG